MVIKTSKLARKNKQEKIFLSRRVVLNLSEDKKVTILQLQNNYFVSVAKTAIYIK